MSILLVYLAEEQPAEKLPSYTDYYLTGLSIVPLDEGVNVRHARVTDLDRVPVEDGVQLGAFGKMGIE